jgi:ADP-ribose pyrophosphatase YjhB (NUDIX family)
LKRYSYCPVCGIELDRSAGAGRAVRLYTCRSCGFEFWQNSKPAVGALIVRSREGVQEILLTRRAIDPYKGLWDLPGGYLDNGEHPEDGLRREIGEELGTTVLGVRLFSLGVDEYLRLDVAEEARFVLGLYYRCEIPADASLVPADDVAEAAWFPLAALPAEIAFASNRRVLQELREALAHGTSAAG